MLNCRPFIIALIVCFCAEVTHAQKSPTRLRVMSFNLWHGGDAGGLPLEQSIAVIRAARADIVGLQETAGNAAEGEERPDHAQRIAQALGWNYLNQGGRTGIISRFPIDSATELNWGVKISLPSGESLYHFNAHFAASPYQPYQLLKIPYGDAPFLSTSREAIQAALEARGAQVASLLSDIQGVSASQSPIFVSGDFNEPSHLDWTESAFKSSRCPLVVSWPTTRLVEQAGFQDGYRFIHHDPNLMPGMTWTPTTSATDPQDRHDRIDFVFASKNSVRIVAAEIIGENRENADIVVAPYPSDHRAVVIEALLTSAKRENEE